MARPRSVDYERQRERILQLAVEAFCEIGYPSASMSRLAQASGVSKATLYHYFESKEALLFEALQRHTRGLLALVEDARARTQVGPERWAQVVRTLMPEYRRSRAFHAALINDLKFLPAQQRETIIGHQRAIVDAIAQTLVEAFPQRVHPQTRKAVTMALLGMLNFTFAWLRTDGPMSYEAFGELALELSLKGLGAGEALATAD